MLVIRPNSNNIDFWYYKWLRLHLNFFICLADVSENLGWGNCECTNVLQKDREVRGDVQLSSFQDDAKKQVGSGQ